MINERDDMADIYTVHGGPLDGTRCRLVDSTLKCPCCHEPHTSLDVLCGPPDSCLTDTAYRLAMAMRSGEYQLEAGRIVWSAPCRN